MKIVNSDGHDRAPDPPGARQAAHNAEQKHDQQAAQHQVHAEILELIAHPGAEGLGGEAVFVLAEIVFVNRERKDEDGGEHEVLQPVDESVHRFETSDALRQIAHAGRPAQIQQQQRDRGSVEEVPEDQPVAAFEIGVGAGRFVGRNLREIGVGGGGGIEVGRGLRPRAEPG